MQQRAAADHPLYKWQEAIWLLTAFLTPLFVNLWVEQQFEASKVWLLRSLIWLLAGLWLYGWLNGLQPKGLSPSLRRALLALFLVLTLSTLLSSNWYIAIFGTLDRANGVLTQLSYLLLFVCVATQIDAQSRQRLLHVAILTAVPICLLGVVQATGWQPLPLFTDARSPLTTTLGRANFTAAYLALLLPLIFTAAQLAAHRWQRLGYGALLLVTGSVILLTQARAGWIAAVVGVGLLVWLQFVPRWSLRVRWLTALAGLSGLLGGLLLVLQRGIASGGSIAARWTIWQASLRLLWPRLWLGYGADSLELYFPSVYPPQLVYYQGRGVVVDRAHNWLLDWSLNYGVVATLIFIVFLLLILRMGWQQITQKDSEVANFEERRWLAASLAAICAHLVGNLFLFEVAATAVLFWLLLAVVVASTTTLSVPHSVPVAGPRWRHAAVLSGVILVWGIAVWQGNVRPLLADRHSWLGTQALNQGEAGRALAEYETAVAIQPKRVPYLVALALIAAQVGNFEQAEEGINEAIVLRPIDPVLYTYLAAIAAREAIQTESPEKGDQAYAAYERAIDLAPTIGLTNQQFADFALRWGDSETAVLQAQQAVTLDATDGIAFGILGWAQLQLGNLAAAQHAFEQAVKWQPDSADFHLGLATAAYEQRDLMLARQAVQRSLSIDASFAPAIALQIELQEK